MYTTTPGNVALELDIPVLVSPFRLKAFLTSSKNALPFLAIGLLPPAYPGCLKILRGRKGLGTAELGRQAQGRGQRFRLGLVEALGGREETQAGL